MKLQSLLGEMKVVEIPFDIPDEEPAPAPAPIKPAVKPKAAPRASTAVATRSQATPARASTAVAPAQQAPVPATRSNDELAMSRLRDLMTNVPDDDEPPVEMEPAAQPDTTAGALVRVGDVNPQWTRVGDLPMYILGPIRRLAKDLFAGYTDTPLERIEVIANYGGNGPNSNQEIDAVAKWILDNGELVSSDTVDFEQTMPGYRAETRLFDVDGREFLLVKDDHGKYVYSWSSTGALSQDKAQELLKR